MVLPDSVALMADLIGSSGNIKILRLQFLTVSLCSVKSLFQLSERNAVGNDTGNVLLRGSCAEVLKDSLLEVEV